MCKEYREHHEASTRGTELKDALKSSCLISQPSSLHSVGYIIHLNCLKQEAFVMNE